MRVVFVLWCFWCRGQLGINLNSSKATLHGRDSQDSSSRRNPSGIAERHSLSISLRVRGLGLRRACLFPTGLH